VFDYTRNYNFYSRYNKECILYLKEKGIDIKPSLSDYYEFLLNNKTIKFDAEWLIDQGVLRPSTVLNILIIKIGNIETLDALANHGYTITLENCTDKIRDSLNEKCVGVLTTNCPDTDERIVRFQTSKTEPFEFSLSIFEKIIMTSGVVRNWMRDRRLL
jgi:hypothetical protein